MSAAPPNPPDWIGSLQPALRSRAVCVTGGAGFIGARLVELLIHAGARVAVLDDLSSSSLDRLAPLIESHPERLRFVHGSVLDPEALTEALLASEIIFHLAAVSSVPLSTQDPSRAFAVNVHGAVRVAEAARLERAQRFLYAASCAAYGDAPTPHVETMPARPLATYAASKLAAEHVVAAWARSRGLPGLSLRIFNAYGVGQPADSAESAVIPAFCTRLREGKPLLVHGDGSQTRDFVHVDDVCRAFLLAATTDKSLTGEAVNIGSGKATSIRDLASMILRVAGRQGEAPELTEPRAGDLRDSRADTTRARELLGFEAQTPLEPALARVVDAFLDVPSARA